MTKDGFLAKKATVTACTFAVAVYLYEVSKLIWAGSIEIPDVEDWDSYSESYAQNST